MVYSKSYEEHKKLLRSVLRTLQEYKLYPKLSRCEFWLNTVEFLRYDVFKEDISVDPNKVEAVMQWNIPINVTEIQSFLILL